MAAKKDQENKAEEKVIEIPAIQLQSRTVIIEGITPLLDLGGEQPR